MRQSILCFGEILYDMFPSYQRLGGAPFNFAYHMHSLGFPSILVSRVGEDENGREITAFLKKSLGDDAIQVDPSHDTGKVLIEIDEKGVPDFDIIKDVAYDYIEYDDAIKKALSRDPSLIYFGTLAQRNIVSRSTLEKMISKNRSARVFYDMNLRQNYFSKEILEWSLTVCNVVKLNDDELETCKSLFQRSDPDDSFVRFLMERFDLEWLCLTRGEQGSILFHDSKRYAIDHVEEQSIVDTVGAGDAYTAILALGILNSWPPETILNRATEFAGAVCAIEGAIPDNPDFYNSYLPWMEETHVH